MAWQTLEADTNSNPSNRKRNQTPVCINPFDFSSCTQTFIWFCYWSEGRLQDYLTLRHYCSTSLVQTSHHSEQRAAPAQADVSGEGAAISHSQAWHICLIKKRSQYGRIFGHITSPMTKPHSSIAKIQEETEPLGDGHQPWDFTAPIRVSITNHSPQKPIHTLHVYREGLNLLTFTIHISQHMSRSLPVFFQENMMASSSLFFSKAFHKNSCFSCVIHIPYFHLNIHYFILTA